jgi:hypothetical protein
MAAIAIAYAGFALAPASAVFLVMPFVVAGVAIGCVETAEHAAVAGLAPERLRGSAFGLLAFLQAAGNLAASALAGLLWTAISPEAAFAYLVGWMILALAALLHTATAVIPATDSAESPQAVSSSWLRHTALLGAVGIDPTSQGWLLRRSARHSSMGLEGAMLRRVIDLIGS